MLAFQVGICVTGQAVIVGSDKLREGNSLSLNKAIKLSERLMRGYGVLLEYVAGLV